MGWYQRRVLFFFFFFFFFTSSDRSRLQQTLGGVARRVVASTSSTSPFFLSSQRRKRPMRAKGRLASRLSRARRLLAPISDAQTSAGPSFRRVSAKPLSRAPPPPC